MNNEQKNQEQFYLDKISELLRKSKSDDGTFLDALYNLYLFIGITKSINDIKTGNVMTIEESRERMMQKYESYSARYGSWFYW